MTKRVTAEELRDRVNSCTSPTVPIAKTEAYRIADHIDAQDAENERLRRNLETLAEAVRARNEDDEATDEWIHDTLYLKDVEPDEVVLAAHRRLLDAWPKAVALLQERSGDDE